MNKVVRFYGVFISLWFATNLFLQDTWWLLVILDKFAEYFLIFSLPAFVVALTTKNKTTVVMALLAVLVTSYFYAPFLIPANSPVSKTMAVFEETSEVAAAPTPDVRIATYNVWNQSTDLQAVADLVESTMADIIAVQELTDVQQAEFSEYMFASYPHFYFSQQVYGGTTALFSKSALSNIQELDFGIDRPAILADVDIEGEVLTIVSAHLNPSFWAYHDKPLLEIPENYHQYIKDQNTQARMIISAAKARTDSSAVVLACDCNSQETASTNRLLRSFFKDVFRTIGFQLGKPDEASLKYERKLSHIDYIWFAGSITPTAVYRARESAGSDHAPVIADFYM